METVSTTGLADPLSHQTAVEEPASDRVLIERIRSGDREAAEVLVEQTYRPIYAVLVRLCGGDRDRAADLTQEAFRRAWVGLESFGGRSLVSTWLYRIAYNTFLNSLRRPRPLASLDDEDVPVPADPSPTVEEGLAAAESFRHVRRAVLALPDELRFVVTARYWAELSVREIAREERVTRTAIHKRLHRAFALLGETLERSSL